MSVFLAFIRFFVAMATISILIFLLFIAYICYTNKSIPQNEITLTTGAIFLAFFLGCIMWSILNVKIKKLRQ